MTTRTMVAGIALLFLCVGCSKVPDQTLTLIADSTDPAVIEHTRAVLQKRFVDLKPSYFSSVESRVTGSRMTFIFKNGEPERSILKYLYQTRGSVRAVLLPDSTVIMTGQDIADVQSIYRDSRYMLYFRLTEGAGKKMGAVSSQNIGKNMQVTVDGLIILSTQISGSFSDAFKADSPRMDDTNVPALAVVLRSGELPVGVSDAGNGYNSPVIHN